MIHVISDLHLGSVLCQEKALMAYLTNFEIGPGQTLILNGDVFDNPHTHRLSKLAWKILAKITEIASKKEVIWIRGNHDHPLDKLSLLLGISPVKEEVILKFPRAISTSISAEPKLTIWIHHGDIHDTFILKYPILTYVADVLYHWAQRANHRFARLLKKSSKTYMRNTRLVLDRATEMAYKRDMDVTICGHTHHPHSQRQHFGLKGQNVVEYLNCGSWTEQPCSFVEIDDTGHCELKYFKEVQYGYVTSKTP